MYRAIRCPIGEVLVDQYISRHGDRQYSILRTAATGLQRGASGDRCVVFRGWMAELANDPDVQLLVGANCSSGIGEYRLLCSLPSERVRPVVGDAEYLAQSSMDLVGNWHRLRRDYYPFLGDRFFYKLSVIRVLFVCSKNRFRSPTAEAVFSGGPDLEVMSAGLNRDSETPLTSDLVFWADMIFTMEAAQTKRLRSKFGGWIDRQKVITLGIPDRYEFMDDELVELLERKVEPHLRSRGSK